MKNRLQLNELAAWNYKGSFKDFMDKAKQDNEYFKRTRIQKKQCYIIKDGFRILSDAIVHVDTGHALTEQQWDIILQLFKQKKIVRQEESDKPRFDGEPVMLYCLSNGTNLYGLCVEWFPNKNTLPFITTAFQGTQAQIDWWFDHNAQTKKKKARQGDGNSPSVIQKESLLGRDLNNIITYLKKNVNPLYEKFEELETGVFATNSKYDVVNYLKNKPKIYRIIYDPSINYYFIGDGFNYIHQDILEIAYDYGFYPEMFSSSEMVDYMQDKMMDGQILLFAFYPNENKTQDIEKSSDGYTRKYVYDFGVIYVHEMTPLEDFDIYKTLGTPIKKEEIFEMMNIKKLNEKLEEALGNTVYFGSDHFDPETIYYSTEPLHMDNTAEINLDGNLMIMTCNDEDIYVNNTSFKSLEEIKKAIEEAYADIVAEDGYVELVDGVFDDLGGFEFDEEDLPDNAQDFVNLILSCIVDSYVDGDSSSASIIFDKNFNIILGEGLSLVKHEEDEEEE